ncbi:MAG: 4-(cytidine 5'-diphospho)-2-C-methyl-D-erythritol kinase [Rhodobacteraceae bacterium]|nr:4-(cytidine 5'-diphospho)-2-C-methyl-D-erythritol kinase [Paracoccaceae bacterium]
MAIEDFAPAKVNLTLHVTGRRADGYHLLDSLVVFADCGDRLRVEPGADLELVAEGPFAGALGPGADNLVLRAARLMDPGRGARITLRKNLPVAAGLGGGSADAAATLRALAALWAAPLPDAAAAAGLGADVPVCLAGRPARMRGRGERIEPVAPLPEMALVLANPGERLATAEVFAALSARDNAPMPDQLPAWDGFEALVSFLAAQRNDLEPPARRLRPAIGDVLAALSAQPGCRLARMSGSGATCFGLFAARPAADAAADALRRARPGWWVEAAGPCPAPST